ncbi:ABC transporter permease [Actinomadura spongiicola]|uniref:ABC transporter permease n=1 Tax=Actinomadura spongiicola TaxID=2303421 RepID=A0A372GP73_9ACTN|nr:ABC transporter permease [Actinomadura spongiicola]RFS87198.1 ABC transporter permease [Actinomadura spongiicola]
MRDERTHDRRKPIAVLVVVSLIGLIFTGSFLGALHHLEPHKVPVAVVAPPHAVDRLGALMERKAEGAFDLTAYDDQRKARDALLERDVDAVFVPGAPGAPGKGGATLIVAGANGRTVQNAVTAAFQGVGQATGQPVTVKDVRPLPDGDNNGVSAIFFVITTVIPAVILAVLLAVAAPRVGAGRRLGLLAAGSVALGGVNAWVAAGLTGALTGAPLELWALASLLVFAVASFAAGAWRVAGPPAVGLTALLFIPIGVPASGGPIGPQFIPQWYATVGDWLPVAASVDAVRNTVYFDGNAIGGPLLVLALWVAAGLALVVVPKKARERAAVTTEPAVGS